MARRSSNKTLSAKTDDKPELCVSLGQERWPPVLDKLLDDLFEKRDSTREKALISLIQEFNKDDVQLHDFVEHKFATILYLCLNSVKKGSSKEVSLAARYLGLVSLSTVPGSHIAQEIRQESLSPISEALKSNKFDLLSTCYSSLVDCLAIITFLGGIDKPEETEEAIKILRFLINPDHKSVTPPSIIASVVHAFALLLTTKDKLPISPDIWQEPICFLLVVLDQEKDTRLWFAAAQALALSFEIPSLIKFCPKGSDGGSFKRDDLKRKVINKLRIMNAQYVYKFDELIGFLDHNKIPQGLTEYTINTWGEFLLMEFFWKHCVNGRLFLREDVEYEEDESVLDDVLTTFMGFRMTKTEKRPYKSPNSFRNKERTKVINKKRGLQECSKSGLYTIAV